MIRGVSIGVLDAFNELTRQAFAVWPVEAELNTGRLSDNVAGVNAGRSEPLLQSKVPYLWMAAGH